MCMISFLNFLFTSLHFSRYSWFVCHDAFLGGLGNSNWFDVLFLAYIMKNIVVLVHFDKFDEVVVGIIGCS